tara:strand:+ start:1428 stop:1565 length:138 start_codon:yes stop_codon:yes gene_type:complete
MPLYKITFDFKIEVDCEEENINNEVKEWLFHNDTPYKIQTITEVK